MGLWSLGTPSSFRINQGARPGLDLGLTGAQLGFNQGTILKPPGQHCLKTKLKLFNLCISLVKVWVLPKYATIWFCLRLCHEKWAKIGKNAI